MQTKTFFAIAHTDISSETGGPPGYLYNLLSGFDGNDRPDILVLNSNTNSRTEVYTSLDGVKSHHLVDILRSTFPGLRIILYQFKTGIRFKEKFEKVINNYGLIHVHSSEVVFYLRRFCRYKGLVVFTPHRPETIFQEAMHSLSDKKKHRCLKLWLNYLEKCSYKLCNAFIFPSKGAASIYLDFPGYKKYGYKKIHKYVYTGVRKKDVTISRADYRKKYAIGEDSFVVAYIGRHSTIKGYDRLTHIYPDLKLHGIEVVCAGKESHLPHPIDTGWHELGYISDTQNLIHASDVVVIPNRNTYFDLVILESLAQGRIVISSNTGGNIDIANETRTLKLFDNKDENGLLKLILEILSLNSEQIRELEENAIDFYYKNLDPPIFASRYLSVITEMVKDCQKWSRLS